MTIEISTKDLNKIQEWLEYVKYEDHTHAEEIDKLIDRLILGIK